ncbi:serine hydrolase domain-containing protein [Nonomuraea sp. NPDC052265]|uniref:serine hydrolase domain-containing protein n=1 Tax=Nonomuraea sp. NPDC052265 TaxID=3364374 RepID=UPI0037C93295
MSQLQQRLSALVDEAGYRRDEPIVVGMQHGGRPPVLLAQGLTLNGEPLGATTLAYMASLSKQMTAACAAQLAQQGELDMESALSRWLPQLPAWADAVRLRHLVHHTAGMPADAKIEALMGRDADRTTEGIIQALARFPVLDREPGAAHAYFNAGYVCLAAAVQRALGQPLPDFARSQLFTPLAMVNTRYWTGPDPAPPGAAPLVSLHPAPLSVGDGGVWSTATDLLRWGQALNADGHGRMLVDAMLRSTSHPEMFGSGDAAAAQAVGGQARMSCQTGLPDGPARRACTRATRWPTCWPGAGRDRPGSATSGRTSAWAGTTASPSSPGPTTARWARC